MTQRANSLLLSQEEIGTNFNIIFSSSGITIIDRLENVIGILVFSQGSTENLDRISTKANFISISEKRFPMEQIYIILKVHTLYKRQASTFFFFFLSIPIQIRGPSPNGM